MSEQFFTWESLSAMGGASLLTFYIVQYSKDIVQTKLGIKTDFYAITVSYFILLFAQLALGANGYDWKIYALTFANSFIVASAAAQIQLKSVNPPNSKRENIDGEF